MNIYGFDHIVLCVRNLDATLDFYGRVLGLNAQEERAGKWALYFGACKISLQTPEGVPAMAKGTLPGTGNFCLLTDTPINEIVDRLNANDIEILVGPAPRDGAVGTLMSVYFNDPDGNLVEISNRVISGVA